MDKEKSATAKRVFRRRAVPSFFAASVLGWILLGYLVLLGLPPSAIGAAVIVLIPLSLFLGHENGVTAVERAGISQRRRRTWKFSSPRPQVDAPPLELRRVARNKAATIFILAIVCLVSLLFPFMFGGANAISGYLLALVSGAVALWNFRVWQQRGHCLLRFDTDQITLHNRKELDWRDVAACQLVIRHNIVGEATLLPLIFLGADGQTIATVPLDSADIAHDRLIAAIQTWFSEMTQEGQTAPAPHTQNPATQVLPSTEEVPVLQISQRTD